VARQFGLCQVILVFIFESKEKVMIQYTALVKGHIQDLIQGFNNLMPHFNLMPYELAHYSTIFFYNWWGKYYNSISVPLDTCYANMATKLKYAAQTKSKRKGMFICISFWILLNLFHPYLFWMTFFLEFFVDETKSPIPTSKKGKAPVTSLRFTNETKQTSRLWKTWEPFLESI